MNVIDVATFQKAPDLGFQNLGHSHGCPRRMGQSLLLKRDAQLPMGVDIGHGPIFDQNFDVIFFKPKKSILLEHLLHRLVIFLAADYDYWGYCSFTVLYCGVGCAERVRLGLEVGRVSLEQDLNRSWVAQEGEGSETF